MLCYVMLIVSFFKNLDIAIDEKALDVRYVRPLLSHCSLIVLCCRALFRRLMKMVAAPSIYLWMLCRGAQSVLCCIGNGEIDFNEFVVLMHSAPKSDTKVTFT